MTKELPFAQGLVVLGLFLVGIGIGIIISQ